VLFTITTLGIFAAVPSLRALDRSMEEGRERETARRATAASDESGPMPMSAAPRGSRPSEQS
jgi:hypothetical protein